MNKYFYTYSQFTEDMAHLVTIFNKRFKDVKVLMPIVSGGLPAAVWLKNLLDHHYGIKLDVCPLDSMGHYSYSQYYLLTQILVIDDIADTGQTLFNITNELHKTSHLFVNTFTLFYKQSSVYTPDLYLRTTEDWVVFPWELS